MEKVRQGTSYESKKRVASWATFYASQMAFFCYSTLNLLNRFDIVLSFLTEVAEIGRPISSNDIFNALTHENVGIDCSMEQCGVSFKR